MSFEYFNTSSLAFGVKLTAAFTQLDNLRKSANRTIEDILELQDIFNEVIGKNYQVPAPIKLTSACRTNEIFDVIRDKIFIKEFDIKNGFFTVQIVMLGKYTNKITLGKGQTKLKSGYAFVIPSSSNKNIIREIRFSDKPETEGNEIKLFKYNIDDQDKITVLGDLSTLKVYPQDYTQYKSLSKGENLPNPYTAKDYCCVCVVGHLNNIAVYKNGVLITKGNGNSCIRHTILYLKPDDKVHGTISKMFKVNYNF